MNALETLASPVKADPRTIHLPSTEGDDVLQQMIDLVRQGRWTARAYVGPDGSRCTIGLLQLLGH